jgi:tripartite-type tricarboxylate transporter receptor subunit TctC
LSKLHCRASLTLLALLALAAILCGRAAVAQGLAYPSRNVTFIVPFTPGSGADIVARILVPRLAERWAVGVITDNRAGATGAIGADFVAKSAPDGYTLILVSTSFTVNPTAYSTLPFDPVKDFVPISLVSRLPLMLVVNPQMPVNSVRELIDLLKAKQGQINFSSIGNGTTQHLAGELFKPMAGVDMVHVPYKGSGPSMMSVVSG